MLFVLCTKGVSLRASLPSNLHSELPGLLTLFNVSFPPTKAIQAAKTALWRTTLRFWQRMLRF